MSLAACLLVLLPASSSWGKTLDLDYQAPPECPDRSALLDSYQGVVEEPAAFAASIEVHQEELVYVAEIHVEQDGQESTRVIEAEDCASLAEASVLYLLLATATGPTTPVAQLDATPPPSTPGAWFVGAQAGVDKGGLPGLAPTFSLHTGRSFGTWSGELSFRGGPAKEITGPDERGAQFRLWTGGVRICHGRRLRLCMGAEAGRLQAESQGNPQTKSPVMPWLAPTSSLRAELYRSDWGLLRLSAQLARPLYRDRFRYQRADTLYRPSQWSARIGLGYLFFFSDPD